MFLCNCNLLHKEHFTITRYKNKQLFPNIRTFDEVPNESEYYKTIRGECFMIFKNSNILIFQSPFQAKLFMENNHIFADGYSSIHYQNLCYRIIYLLFINYLLFIIY